MRRVGEDQEWACVGFCSEALRGCLLQQAWYGDMRRALQLARRQLAATKVAPRSSWRRTRMIEMRRISGAASLLAWMNGVDVASGRFALIARTAQPSKLTTHDGISGLISVGVGHAKAAVQAHAGPLQQKSP
eukprot:14933956-Alexandrium_andersonii.AAC.2